MGSPGAIEVKGSALMFSTYLVRKSIAIAYSLAFLSQTWLVTMADRPAAKKIPTRPNAIVASTNENAATPLVRQDPARAWPDSCISDFAELPGANLLPWKNDRFFHASLTVAKKRLVCSVTPHLSARDRKS